MTMMNHASAHFHFLPRHFFLAYFMMLIIASKLFEVNPVEKTATSIAADVSG